MYFSNLCRKTPLIDISKFSLTFENVLPGMIHRNFYFIGREPIPLENGAQCQINSIPVDIHSETYKKTPFHQMVTLNGPLGSLAFKIPLGLSAIKENLPCSMTNTDTKEKFQLRIIKDENPAFLKSLTTKQKLFIKAMWGTSQRIISKQIIGVSEGHRVLLKLVGVGYRAKLEENSLILKLGYSHLIQMPIPEGIKVTIPLPTKIVLEGIDYHLLTQFASKIRSKRKPEPYNGKGIFVGNETIIRKEGKKK